MALEMLTPKMIVEAVRRGDAVVMRRIPSSKSTFNVIYREFAPVGAVIASPKKWEQKKPDGSWEEIPMPGILGNSATLMIMDGARDND